MTTQIPDAEETAQEAASTTALTLREVQTLEVVSQQTYEVAADILQQIKSRYKAIEEERKRILRPLDESRRKIMDLFRPALDNLVDAEKMVKAGMRDYSQEQEKIRQEEEAKAREAARKEADRLQKRALRAAEKGHDEQAAALQEMAESVPVPIVAPQPKVAGISTREAWKAQVVDKATLIKAVAEGKVPDAVLDPNMKALNEMARALKGSLNYPGVKAIVEETVVARDPLAKPQDIDIPQPRNRKNIK